MGGHCNIPPCSIPPMAASSSPRSLPDLPAAVNFGPGDASQETARLRAFRPTTLWWANTGLDGSIIGPQSSATNTDKQVAEYESLLKQGYSSISTSVGGTSFGWMNGANSDGKNYEPDVTSYDYDAPISERGSPREVFQAPRCDRARNRH